MIEHVALRYASTQQNAPAPAWTRPSLPRGPSPLARRVARVRAWFARPAAARQTNECRC